MGKKGYLSQRNVGEKEENGEPRDHPLYCRISESKSTALAQICKLRKISKAEAISEALEEWIRKHTGYLTDR